MRNTILTLALAALALAAEAAPKKSQPAGTTLPKEFRAGSSDGKITTANWGPKRLKPVFTGPFQVDLVVIAFPDCEMPDPETVRNDLDHIQGGAFTIKDYYDDYSQNVTYPVLSAYPSVYLAPQPFGYYCRWQQHSNKVGWKSDGEGHERVAKLRQDAFAHVQKSKKTRKGEITCYVYCRRLDKEKVLTQLRSAYPKPKEDHGKDPIGEYAPAVAWAEPLWPNSLPQVTWPGDGSAMVHELGHDLGSPDYYHAPEKHDGVPGAPCLPWGHSPTGMACDRVIYHAFVPPETYPVYKTDGTYVLDPRASRVSRTPGDPQPVLGCFIPSSHPNYMFYLEYVHGEKKPVGDLNGEGLLVHVINVTFTSPMLGPPDLCYTYRTGDKFMKGVGSVAYLGEGDSFTMKTDPAARIPPLIEGGIEITDIKPADGKCAFTLKFTNPKYTPKDLKDALLPRIRLCGVEEVTATSLRPSCEMMYRGEPLVEEYGFTWDTSPHPVVTKNKFPLYHRDRWDARIIGLKPATKYYVRAYCRNANGVTYSKVEKEITTLAEPKEVPALLTDKILGNFYITRWYWQVDPDQNFNSANAIIALMSLGVYYGAMPGGAAKGAKPLDVRRVHTNPSESRPPKRMTDYGAYYEAMRDLAKETGLRERAFGKMADWQKRCAKALKVKDPRKMFVQVKTAADLEAQRGEIKKWLDRSEPVMLVRENDFMPEVTDRRYPLDIAFIDGYDDEGEWHVTFPLGKDRNTVPSGHHSAKTLMVSVKDAVLMYYRP